MSDYATHSALMAVLKTAAGTLSWKRCGVPRSAPYRNAQRLTRGFSDLMGFTFRSWWLRSRAYFAVAYARILKEI